jgi:hypothetical protein
MAIESSDTRPRGDILPMGVSDLTFLVNRLGEDCAPLQYVRELTQNAIEGISHLERSQGEIVWDVSWSYYDLSDGGLKLSCIDTGIGMTGLEMVRYINNLSSSVHQQSAGGNFGVGAKIAAAPKNPHGLVYMSWKEGVGHMIHLWFDPEEKLYGLKRWPQNNGEFWTRVSDDLKPPPVKDHGTVVVLHGLSDDDNTMEPPLGTPMKSRWILRYLNTRYFRFPKGITVQAREGWELPRSDKRHNFLRVVEGQGAWLDKNCESSGFADLTNARAHWWILKDDIDKDSGHFTPGGHGAALYQNELYELAYGRAGVSRLMNFGVIFGTDRVVIYVEPSSTGDQRVTSNTARTHLLVDGKPLDWAGLAAEFREKLPTAIVQLQEQIGAQSGEKDYRKAIHERLKQIRDLLRFSRFRPAKDGSATADPTLETDRRLSGSSGESSGEKKRKGGLAGDIYSLFAESGDPAEAVDAFDEPNVKWISGEDGTRTAHDLEDRAARFLLAQNQLLINADFRVFTDMVERWNHSYAHIPGARATVSEVVHEWFQQQLMEAVMSARALKSTGKWSFEELESLWSEEALTAAVLPRWHIDQSIKRNLGQRLGSLKVA